MVPAIQNLKSTVNRFVERKYKLILSIAFIVLFVQGIFNLLWLKHGSKTAYINTETVYNDFGLKKKMESDLKRTQLARTGILDSMKLQLDMMYSHMEENQQLNDSMMLNAFANLRDRYFKRQQEFKEANETLAQQYTSQIWSQLNQYLQDYGHAKGYEYIFGANGDGNLMFADDAVNITEEVKGYVNERFKGQP